MSLKGSFFDLRFFEIYLFTLKSGELYIGQHFGDVIKDGYKDEESSTGSWIFSTNPIFIISGMTIRMWNKEIKLFYE